MTKGSIDPGRNPTPLEDAAVRRQLEGLFGASLFGGWPELEQSMGKVPRRRRSLVWLWRLLALVVTVVVVWGTHQLLKPGLKRQVEDQRANYAQELQTFINDGELERAAKYAPIVRTNPASASEDPNSAGIDPKDPHLDLIVSAEAALYRYFDADPARLQRIVPFIDPRDQLTPLRQLARFTVRSRGERASVLPLLERLRSELPNHNELEYLLATAFEERGNVIAARAAWEHSANLGPAWLGHRFEQAWFEWRQDQKPVAQRIAAQIVRTDPDSLWSKLAIAKFELPKDIARESVRGDAAAPVISPVQTFFEQLGGALDAAHRHDLGRAKDLLLAAANAIHQQQPFLFDAFDWILADQLPELALAVTELADWPRSSEAAQVKLDRLSASALGSKSAAAAGAQSAANTKASARAKRPSQPPQTARKRKASRRQPK